MRRGRQTSKRPLGPMVTERIIPTKPSFVRLVEKFGFFEEAGTPQGLKCFNWLKSQKDIQERLAKVPAVRSSNTVTAECQQLDAVLGQMTMQQVARLRLRWEMYFALNFGC